MQLSGQLNGVEDLLIDLAVTISACSGQLGDEVVPLVIGNTGHDHVGNQLVVEGLDVGEQGSDLGGLLNRLLTEFDVSR